MNLRSGEGDVPVFVASLGFFSSTSVFVCPRSPAFVGDTNRSRFKKCKRLQLSFTFFKSQIKDTSMGLICYRAQFRQQGNPLRRSSSCAGKKSNAAIIFSLFPFDIVASGDVIRGESDAGKRVRQFHCFASPMRTEAANRRE